MSLIILGRYLFHSNCFGRLKSQAISGWNTVYILFLDTTSIANNPKIFVTPEAVLEMGRYMPEYYTETSFCS
jgi:hypothetical protein